jgi:hypothetical protein
MPMWFCLSSDEVRKSGAQKIYMHSFCKKKQ